ncbi:MAG TPA: SusD/RagB family nutrient-binding outer membrane lipoprotein [Gemmatimonadaceae bacterium]|nr:SusD/RagB family nutrient-binding outer membrane lipoprotein [Gemmatimonadaceae bacterium]
MVVLGMCGAAGCSDFLTGGDLSTDPNRPTVSTNQQTFVGVQTELWALLTSDPARYAGLWTQQFEGGNIQYINVYHYGLTEATTNGFHTALYTAGGLVDIRKLEAGARALDDNWMLGIAQVQEALTIGTGADLFGDLVYTHALKGEQNPPLTPQLEIYDSVQVLLSSAITNLQSSAATNVGPGDADLSYAGDPAQWIRLAHTLRARFALHTAEVEGAPAYQRALAEAAQGITDPADDFVASYSGNVNEQNLWYQFAVVQRPGYLLPNSTFISQLEAASDPRRTAYFDADGTELAAPLLSPTHTQPLVTANENLLIWSEAAYRTGDEPLARQKLNEERALWGVGPVAATLSGQALLAAILNEKYVAMFQSIEVWNDYKRTCWPNLTPTQAGEKIPARLYYDVGERQTNTSIPLPSGQPTRNANDPANGVSDATGAACLGQ